MIYYDITLYCEYAMRSRVTYDQIVTYADGVGLGRRGYRCLGLSVSNPIQFILWHNSKIKQ